jgi:hypothetical protein
MNCGEVFPDGAGEGQGAGDNEGMRSMCEPAMAVVEKTGT